MQSEAAPLLGPGLHREAQYDGMEDRSNSSEEVLPKTNSEIFKFIFTTAYPIACALVLEITCNFIMLFFASRVRNSDIPAGRIFAGVSLATMFANVTCFSIHEGMTGAVETFGSQANGAGLYRKVGIIWMRSVAVLSVISIPLLTSWIFVAHVLRLLGVEDDVCGVVHLFLQVRMIAVPVDIVCISYDKYLVAIGVVDPAMYSSLIFNIVLALMNYIFIVVLEYDFPFIAWSYVIAAICHVGFEVVLSLSYEEVQRTLTIPTWEIFDDWGPFFGLGIPGCVMICAEWWAYEILTVFASVLGPDAVDSQTIVLQISVLVFMLPYGLGVASASIVGNALGARDAELARRSGSIALFMIFLVDILLAIFLVTIGPFYIQLLTTDPDVTKTTNHLLPFLAIFIMMDGLQGVCSGILRGAGKQSFGAVLGFLTYYFLGLPMAWFLTFNCKFGVSGLVIGISTGACVQTIVLLSLITFFSPYVFTVYDGGKDSSNSVPDKK